MPCLAAATAVQVLMQLAQAYLTTKQPSKVLDCISIMQGLSTGRTPPAGLLQLSSLALLQQGKVGAASAQLCAWLRQGGQGTEEACSAVRSFLVALHPQGSSARQTAPTVQGRHLGDRNAAAGEVQGAGRCSGEEHAAAVQQVAAAAAEHCRADPAVALEVVLQLLAEQVARMHSLTAQVNDERTPVACSATADITGLSMLVASKPFYAMSQTGKVCALADTVCALTMCRAVAVPSSVWRGWQCSCCRLRRSHSSYAR